MSSPVDFAREVAENTLTIFQGEITATFDRWKTQFSDAFIKQMREKIMERLHTPVSYTANFGEIKYDILANTPLIDSKDFHYYKSFRGNVWQGQESTGETTYRIRNVDYDTPNRPIFDITRETKNGEPPFPIVRWAPPHADEYVIFTWEYSGITILTSHFNIYYFPRVENIPPHMIYKHQCPHVWQTSNKRLPDDMIDFMKHYCDEATDRDRDGSFATFFRVKCESPKQAPTAWLKAADVLHKFILDHIGKHWSRRTHEPSDLAEERAKLDASRAALEREKANMSNLRAFYELMRTKITNTQEKLKSLSTEAKKTVTDPH